MILKMIYNQAKSFSQIGDAMDYVPNSYIIEESDLVYYDNPLDELIQSGTFFPNHPVKRTLYNTKFSVEKIDSCSKNYDAGIILFWCVRHRVCLGFVLLERDESCESVYSTIVSRFEKMPNTLIYDNGCNLAEYCYNRSPELFVDTKFVVDGFHYPNHKNCSHSFNASLHLQLKSFSSVVHEQKNAFLAKSKIPVMKDDNDPRFCL